VTGSCDSKRELYTTDSEYAFKLKRPVIVNGMSAYASQTLWRGLLGVTSVRGRAKQEVAEEGLSSSRAAARVKIINLVDLLMPDLRSGVTSPTTWRPGRSAARTRWTSSGAPGFLGPGSGRSRKEMQNIANLR
jgi:hypothetical protein